VDGDAGGRGLLCGDLVRGGEVSAPAFTSGPWQRRDDYGGWLTIIGNVDGESFSDGTTSYTYDFIANCEDEYGEPAKPENVRLILAAPELYETLDGFVEARDRYLESDCDSHAEHMAANRLDEAHEAARAALAKARGGQ
jgi:hypothetical protein